MQDLVQDLASLARKLLARFACFLQDRFCTIFDFASKNSVSVDVSKESTADGIDQANAHVLSVLKGISSTLNTLVGRVENTEKEIR